MRFPPRAALSLLLLLGSAQAAPLAFQHRDWSLGCDNTGRCEAVGHQAEEDEGVIALSLQRDAGPGALVHATLFIEDDASPGEVQLTIGRQRLDAVAVGGALPAAQASALLRHLLEGEVAIARSGKHTWRLSLAGLKAVLLKMDEAQGRLDTPGALVRKGKRPESAVPPMVPGRALIAQAVPRTTASDEKLLPQILKALPLGECQPDLEASLHRLSVTKLLVLRQCIQGAYQSGWDLWAVNARAPFQPTRLHLPDGSQESRTELVEPSFDDGVLSSYAKGRGLNDCGEAAEWLWTDSGFQLLSRNVALMCRGMTGGVPVRMWDAGVARAKK